MVLQWRAVCPTCKVRVTRKGNLSETQRCVCGTQLRQNKKWNQNFLIGTGAVGLIGGMALAWATGKAPLGVMIAAEVVYLAALLAAAAWLWPYATKYERADEPQPNA